MSLLKKLGFDEFLQSKGLTEAQVKVIYSQEIEKLQKQETAMRAEIDKAVKKMEEQYTERQRLSQAMDGERLVVEKAHKNLLAEKTLLQNDKNALLQLQRDILVLREKLNEDKTLFRQEKDAIQKMKLDAEASVSAQHEILRNLVMKEQETDKLKDALVLQEHKLQGQEKFMSEVREKLSLEVNALEAAKFEANSAKETLERERDVVQKIQAEWKARVEDGLKELSDKTEAFKKETELERDALRRREYAIVEKEKAIEDKEADLKAQKETLAIKRAKK